VSRFVPAMLAKRAAEQLGVPMDTDTQRKIAEIADLGLKRLSRLQLEDGGWGWWEAEEPNAWLTAYAVWGLRKAKQAGVPVPEPMYRKGVDALRRQVVESIEKIAARDSQAGMPIWWDELFPLMTLALVDPTPPDRLRYDSKLLSKWMAWLTDTGASDGSDRWRQVYRLQWVMILHHWRGLPNAEAHLRALWRALQREASEDRNHIDWEPPHADEWFWYSWHRMETQAIALLALVEARPLATELFGSPQRYEQLVGKTVTGLALGCRNGRWYSSRDTALAVEALLEYSLRYERGYRRESEYEVWLNGQRVRTVAVGAPGGAACDTRPALDRLAVARGREHARAAPRARRAAGEHDLRAAAQARLSRRRRARGSAATARLPRGAPRRDDHAWRAAAPAALR
jgi:hypothetical protein